MYIIILTKGIPQKAHRVKRIIQKMKQVRRAIPLASPAYQIQAPCLHLFTGITNESLLNSFVKSTFEHGICKYCFGKSKLNLNCAAI